MSRVTPQRRIPVGIVVERRKAKSPWADFVWRAVAALPGVPETAPWTMLDGDADCTNFYAGAGEIELYRSESSAYRDNLATGAALLWVVLRPSGDRRPYAIAAVTADPGEGEGFTEAADDLVDTVPMPEPVRAVIADFVAEHHLGHEFVKRKRDRADPEAMARRDPMKKRK
jgi:hypothetical protein